VNNSRIACIQCIDAAYCCRSLARSVVCVSVSLYVLGAWMSFSIQLHRPRCLFEVWLIWVQGTMDYYGESFRLPPPGVTRLCCDFLPNYFGLLFLYRSKHSTCTISEISSRLHCTWMSVIFWSPSVSMRHLKLQATYAFRFMHKHMIVNTRFISRVVEVSTVSNS